MEKNKYQRYPLVPKCKIFEPQNEHDHERFPRIDEKPHLVYSKGKGDIRAGCYFGDAEELVFDLGLVPEACPNKGKEDVQRWAAKRMKALISREKRRLRKVWQKTTGVLRHFEVAYKGKVLRGVVTMSHRESERLEYMKVTMNEPFSASSLIHVRPSCFAESVCRMHSFDDDGDLTSVEIARQDEELVRIYRRELRKRTEPSEHPLLKELPRLQDDEVD